MIGLCGTEEIEIGTGGVNGKCGIDSHVTVKTKSTNISGSQRSGVDAIGRGKSVPSDSPISDGVPPSARLSACKHFCNDIGRFSIAWESRCLDVSIEPRIPRPADEKSSEARSSQRIFSSSTPSRSQPRRRMTMDVEKLVGDVDDGSVDAAAAASTSSVDVCCPREVDFTSGISLVCCRV